MGALQQLPDRQGHFCLIFQGELEEFRLMVLKLLIVRHKMVLWFVESRNYVQRILIHSPFRTDRQSHYTFEYFNNRHRPYSLVRPQNLSQSFLKQHRSRICIWKQVESILSIALHRNQIVDNDLERLIVSTPKRKVNYHQTLLIQRIKSEYLLDQLRNRSNPSQ
jgi:hypothetical protein